jgi:hypothetical protein
MDIVAIPVGVTYPRGKESDIAELSLGPSGLRVVVESYATTFERVWLEYHFAAPRGFRFLDEGDLIRYWKSQVFSTGHHLFEITAGGWRDQELQLPGMLSVTEGVGSFREWFVATTNGSINVLSVMPPQFREFR